jgi:hypothetical protein
MSRFARLALGLLGAILLLPGVCSLGYMTATAFDWFRGYRSISYFELLLAVWAISLAISALGLWLLRRVRSAP